MYPKIIQAGMGVGVSDFRLANTVSGLSVPGRETRGTMSGVSLEKILAIFLKQGGPRADEIIFALRDFPFPKVSDGIIRRYYMNKKEGIPTFDLKPSKFLIELNVCANYAFVMLAQENGVDVSINYLEKIATPHLSSIYGAMLAGIKYITMGAGIPDQIPAVINAYLNGETAVYKIPVFGGERYEMHFDPTTFFGEKVIPKIKPGFVPIVASNTLAKRLAKTLKGEIFGFVIETPTAGGHNAPPRRNGVYGEEDEVNYSEIAGLGLPFWIGGSYASPEKLVEALSVGASGIQVGSAFALSDDSGMDPEIRRRVKEAGFNGTLDIRTDMRISPTGFPFKVVNLTGTISEGSIYMARKRVCDQCALVHYYQRPDGSIGKRCPSEPVETYLKKGGLLADTVGRGCVCNGLITTAGLRFSEAEKLREPAIVTLGDDVGFLKHLMLDASSSYSAKDVVNHLFSKL